MARITIEDCLQKVQSRFELVLIASKRARQLASGAREPKVAAEHDKPTVIALREIARGVITADILSEPDLQEDELAKRRRDARYPMGLTGDGDDDMDEGFVPQTESMRQRLDAMGQANAYTHVNNEDGGSAI